MESRARLLIYLYERGEKGGSVTQLANAFGVSKTSIGRALAWFQKNGMIRRESSRQITLSTYGQTLAKDYRQQRDTARDWMALKGISPKTAEDEAMALVLGAPETLSSVIGRDMRLNAIRQRLRDRQTFSGREFCEALDDGVYPVNFFFYRSGSTQSGIASSMANEGFGQPADLDVKDHVGTLTLHARLIEHPVEDGTKQAVGVLKSMKYQDGDGFTSAQREGYDFRIPVEALLFLNVGGGAFYQGQALTRMACSAGPGHMPESDALFVMFF
jgi:Mn-dependent DtxR family transcriptional regulator